MWWLGLEGGSGGGDDLAVVGAGVGGGVLFATASGVAQGAAGAVSGVAAVVLNGAPVGALEPAHVDGVAPPEADAEPAAAAIVAAAPAMDLLPRGLGTAYGGLVLARVSRRAILGEVLARAGGTGARYRSAWEAGGFVCTVESRVPRRNPAGAFGLVRCIGHVAASITDEEEDAADCLINALRWRRDIVVDDVNWRRVTRMRRQMSSLHNSLDAARGEKQRAVAEKDWAVAQKLVAVGEKEQAIAAKDQAVAEKEQLAVELQEAVAGRQEAVEKALLLEMGLRRAVDDLTLILGSCEKLCSLAADRMVPSAGIADLATLVDALLDLSARVQDNVTVADVCLAAAVGDGA